MTTPAGGPDNPYAAPLAAPGPAPGEAAPRPGRWWPAVWSGVFLGNLVIPLLFGATMVSPAGRAGLALGVGLWWAVGLVGLRQSERARRVAVSGGVCVALSQVVPFLQIMAGMVGLEAATRVEGGPRGEFGEFATLGLAGGLVATLVTGGLLLLAAGGVGLLVQALLGALRSGGGGGGRP